MTEKRSKTHKPNASQAFSLGTKDSPRANQPKLAKSKDYAPHDTRVKSYSKAEYEAMLAREAQEASGGWNDFNNEIMRKLAKGE